MQLLKTSKIENLTARENPPDIFYRSDVRNYAKLANNTSSARNPERLFITDLLTPKC